MVHEQIAGRGVRNSAVLAALSKVERHRLVPEEYVRAAYEDTACPSATDRRSRSRTSSA